MREDILQALSELIKEKTELKTEKVEFALKDYENALQDLFAIRRKIEQQEKKFTDVSKIYKSIRSDLGKLSMQSSKILKNAEKQINKDVKMARELGIDPKGIFAEYQNVKNFESKQQEIIEKMIQSIKVR